MICYDLDNILASEEVLDEQKESNTLLEAIRLLSLNQDLLLRDVIMELKINNSYLSQILGDKITESDIED